MVRAYDSEKKREQLVRAARSLIHEQGFHRTTLAEVAERAHVPLGNVHYYFKTKEALGHAVIAAHETSLRAALATWHRAESDPLRRLQRLVLGPIAVADSVVRLGCPHGSLCYELKKMDESGGLANAAASLLDVYVGWCELQFLALGRSAREARELAVQLIASQQGILLMAQSLRSPQVLKRQLKRLSQSLDDTETSQQLASRAVERARRSEESRRGLRPRGRSAV